MPTHAPEHVLASQHVHLVLLVFRPDGWEPTVRVGTLASIRIIASSLAQRRPAPDASTAPRAVRAPGHSRPLPWRPLADRGTSPRRAATPPSAARHSSPHRPRGRRP